jgi:hypothetical protein
MVYEELHRPRAVGLGRVLEVRQSEADGLRELRPTVRNGRADQVVELGRVFVQRLQQWHGCWDKTDLRMG